MKLKTLLIALATLTLTACTEFVASTAPEGADEAASRSFELLATGQLEALKKEGGPEFRTPQAEAGIAQIVNLLPKEKPPVGKLFSWNTQVQLGGETTTTIVREYDYPTSMVTSTVIMTRKGKDRWVARGVNVNVSPKAPKTKG